MSDEEYDPLSKLVHWLMAAIIIYATTAGYIMHIVEDNNPLFLFLSILNMSLATISAPLLIIRYIWSFFRKTPSLPITISEAQQGIARLVHSLLYLVMFLVFTSGFLMLREEYLLFWIIAIPNPVDNDSINAFFFALHRVACASLAVLVAAHVAAALKHHFIDRDKVLSRMLPKFLRRKSRVTYKKVTMHCRQDQHGSSAHTDHNVFKAGNKSRILR